MKYYLLAMESHFNLIVFVYNASKDNFYSFISAIISDKMAFL